MNSIPSALSPREAFSYLQESAVMVDIRPEFETNFRVFDIPRVYYLPYSSYQEQFGLLPRDVLLIVADSAGIRSTEVVRFLQAQGYTAVSSLAGGIVEWDRDGFPLTKDPDYEIVGGCACRLHPQKKY